MEEKTLLRIALISSLIGVLLILFISERVDISESNIKEAKNQTGNIKVKGAVSSITETPSAYIINLKDNTDTILVLVFKGDSINITKGQIIEVSGKLVDYQGQKEISADTIRI